MSADRETYLSTPLPGATLSVFNMHGSGDVLITLETTGDAGRGWLRRDQARNREQPP